MKISAKYVVAVFLSIIVMYQSCEQKRERSGIVLDADTKRPIGNVSIEIYMSAQKKDSLQVKVFTDSKGYFRITEKRPADLLFIVHKEGYIGFVCDLSKSNDTILLQKQQ